MVSDKKIIITSIGKLGKTITSIGICLNLGNSVGYIKPMGRYISSDIYVVKEILQLQEDIDIIHPAAGMLAEAISTISKYKDYLIIEADLIENYSIASSCIHISKKFDIPVVVVTDYDIDKMQFIIELLQKFDVVIKGVILNKLNEEEKRSIDTKKDSLIIGSIPYSSRLHKIGVDQIIDELSAIVLVGHKGQYNLVDKLLIGAMTPEYAMKYFNQPGKKAIITGGDREDLILAALSSPTACLILTGDICPSKTVLLEAEKKDVPVLLVNYDTLTTCEKIEKLISKLSPQDKEKINLIKQLVKDNVDINRVFS